jgi:hypothetical protein
MADSTWIQARITRTKELIVIYEDALASIASGAQTYSLDTGQTRQVVTKADVASLRMNLSHLENRLSMLELKLCGGGSHYGRGV